MSEPSTRNYELTRQQRDQFRHAVLSPKRRRHFLRCRSSFLPVVQRLQFSILRTQNELRQRIAFVKNIELNCVLFIFFLNKY